VLFTNYAKSLIWLEGINKLKTKYNVLAQCKPESSSLSTALLAHILNVRLKAKTLEKLPPIRCTNSLSILECNFVNETNTQIIVLHHNHFL